MTLSEYFWCFVVGFGGMFIFEVTFLFAYWFIKKMYKVYLNWKNPWRDQLFRLGEFNE